MATQGLGIDVRERVEAVGQQAQDVIQTHFNTTRQIYDVFFSNAQKLAQVEYEAAQGLFDATASRLTEARSGGAEQFAFAPAELLPLGREHWFSAYEDARQQLVKTRDELIEIMRQHYRSVWRAMSGETGSAGKAAPKRAQPAARKAASQPTSTQRKDVSAPASKPAARTRRKTTSARKAAGAPARAAEPATPGAQNDEASTGESSAS